MAELSPEIHETLWILKKQLLVILDKAKATELLLFERFGETDNTLIALNELSDIAEQAIARFSQLSILQLRTAEAQPTVSFDMLDMVAQAISRIQQRVPALDRSIEEIRSDWGLK